MTLKLRSTVVALVSVQVAEGSWSGRNVANVERVDAFTYRVTLEDDYAEIATLVVVGVDSYELVAPGVVELVLDVSRDFSAFIIDTGPGAAVAVSGGGSPPSPAVGYLDLGDVSGAVVLDGAVATAWRARLTGDITVSFANLRPGAKYGALLVQDAIGNHAVTWPVSTQWADAAGAGTIDADPDIGTVVQFFGRTATAATGAQIGGQFSFIVSNEIAGISPGVDGLTVYGGFSSPGDPTLQFQQLTFWLGPCVAPDNKSGTLGLLAAPSSANDVDLYFKGPNAADTLHIDFHVSVTQLLDAGTTYNAGYAGDSRIAFDDDGTTIRQSRVTFTRLSAATVALVIDTMNLLSGAVATANLPTITSANDRQTLSVKLQAALTVAVTPDAGQTVDGAASYAMTASGQAASFIADWNGGVSPQWIAFPGAA
jgi:hypothetical protein